MPSTSPAHSFIADTSGSIEVIRAHDPRNLGLDATQPINIQMDPYLARVTDMSGPVDA